MSKIVFRTLDVFEAFAKQKQPMSLMDIARHLGIAPSSCHDVVKALLDRGYLYEVRPRGGYYPTSRIFQMAEIILNHDPIADRALVYMDEISEALKASVSLCKAYDFELVYLLVSNPDYPLRFTVNAGDRARNLYSTSAGKCLLGALTADARRQYLQSIELRRMTPHTITDLSTLIENIEEAEKRGWFVNQQESVEEALTVSVRLEWNKSIYILTAAGSLTLMQRQLDEAVTLLQQAAQKIAHFGTVQT